MELVSDNATLAPPEGAACPSVTLQTPIPYGPMLAGLQETEDTTAAVPTRLTVVFAELLL
jgi:hypothetical protein